MSDPAPADPASRRLQDIRQGEDDIDRLRTLVMRFCAEQGPTTSALSTARTNFDQAIFWLRTHRNSRAATS